MVQGHPIPDLLGMKGKWVGDFDSPEAALASINEAFLQDKRYWSDLDDRLDSRARRT